MSEKIVEIMAKDGVKLNGYMIQNKPKSDKLLIEIHGMTSNCFKKRERVIAKTVKESNIDSICVNTRGSEVIKYIRRVDDKKELAGTAYEDIYESYYDLLGIIRYAISLGYSSIFLQGHSLGATKVVYTYKKMKENNDKELNRIKGILLLSLVDLPDIFNEYEKEKYLSYAEKMKKANKTQELMPKEAFFYPISVKTYLKYTKYNNDINFAQYSNSNFNYDDLNKIEVPLFMRWGNKNEFIRKSADEQVKLLNKMIKNDKKDISYIDGANHSYNNRETVLANEINHFLEEK